MKSTPTTADVTADAERGEILLTLDGQPYVIRFGLKFLKAFSTPLGDAPADALAALETAPITALLDMVTLGIKLCVPADKLPTGFDADAATDLLDALPTQEQEHIFAVLLASIRRNPLFAALTKLGSAAK